MTARAEVPPAPVRAHAARRFGDISVDGRLDEPAWGTAPRQSGFVQRFPQDDSKPSLETHFAVLYDDEAVYVGVWADDPAPDRLRAPLTRRDIDAPADAITVAFDSYHDRRTAYAFQLNAAGVQRDMLMFDDASQDDSWDAVWTGNVTVTETGWTAEYRVPLSQLRFATRDAQEWGLQVVRRIGRTGELDSWSPWPRSAPQVVSKFGIVDGIDHLKARRRLEISPYATGGVARTPIEAGDPLNQQYALRRNAGVDVKYGLGPAFTISATLNPDFGQVEADPSKINLSSRELFFAEKRPFFLEASDLFKLSIDSDENNAETAFYSRRIGATPGVPESLRYDYLAAPQATTIYGAAKLTGKTASGWSAGVLDAITGPLDTEIANRGAAPTRVSLAALTNYAIARVKRDLGDGDSSLGMSATAVNRELDNADLRATLHDQAYTGGVQLQHRWGDSAWTADVSFLGSWVHGTQEAIAATQDSSVHYFQRPGAKAFHFDPTRTSLSGLTAKWRIGRLGDTQHWRFGTGGDLRTPSLELNDAGYQTASNQLSPFLWSQYREDAPTDYLLNWQVTANLFMYRTFDGGLTDYGLDYGGNVQFLNYWTLSASGSITQSYWTMNVLRGGPAWHDDASADGSVSLSTDTREPVWFSVNASTSHRWATGQLDGRLELGATIQARSNLDLFVGPSLYLRRDPMQYIDQQPDMTGQPHYIFGRIYETDVSMTLRASWAFSPHLGLQVYAQPYIAAGRYDQLKDVDHAGAERYADRFHAIGSSEARLADGTYSVTRANGATFSFDRPDFNFRQLRSNVVLRWEYRPGSTVFATWSHGQTSDALRDGGLQLGRDVVALLRASEDNTVMVKINYWMGL